jgi:chromatin segregation and condensation protein Rec8/ScpA/Scc1 (kleisin family)
MEALNYKLEKFKGPLDLCLTLIKKNKMSIEDIQISILCDQYMEYINSMENADIEISSEFLLMASELMLIKSKMLLPRNEEEEEDPRAALAAAVLEYQRAKEASTYLKDMFEEYGLRMVKDTDEISVDVTYVADQDITSLCTAVRRIIEAQKKSLKKASAEKLTQEQKDLMQALCQKVICPVTQEGISLSLDKDTKKLFVLLAENSYPALGENAQEIRTEGFYGMNQALKNKELILSRFPDAEVIIIQEFPNTPQFERVCALANHCDDVVFFTFNRGGSYIGSEELTKRVEYLIETLTGKLAAIVHIGNPYAVERFQHTRRLLLGFAPGECEEYAVKALAGEYTPTYPLPVSFRK